MNIGFVSTWFERGAAYVTKAYIDVFKETDNVFVYARGGEEYAINNKNWDYDYVTWGKKLPGTQLDYRHFKQWIIKNELDIIFFNEQVELNIVAKIKKIYPNIKLGSYIDYYKESSVKNFDLFDFLICNTHRHYSVFKNHKNANYVSWGTDVDLFKPNYIEKDKLTFFHSMGMSLRKGTSILIEAFIEGELYKYSNLIIHTQIPINKVTKYSKSELESYNIFIREESVSAPGLYHLGDVYVYPTILEGLGLTIYEALSCGLPVIITDNAPMNEVVNEEIGYLVNIEKYYSRSDGYYWPVSICEKNSLIEGMKKYIEKQEDILALKEEARRFAVENLNWKHRKEQIKSIFYNAESTKIDEQLYNALTKKTFYSNIMQIINMNILPNFITINLLKIKNKIANYSKRT